MAAILLLSSQNNVVTPIGVMFDGSGGAEDVSKRSPVVSPGLDITCGNLNGQITIPKYGGSWGTYTVVLLDEALDVSMLK